MSDSAAAEGAAPVRASDERDVVDHGGLAMSEGWTDRSLAAPEAAILFHPDRRTAWAPSIVVSLAEPFALAVAEERLAALAAAHPIVDARLEGARWIAGSGRLDVEPLADELALLRTRFDLAAGPPLRVALSDDGLRLAVVGHHAALDGRALVLVARALLGGGAGSGRRAETPSLDVSTRDHAMPEFPGSGRRAETPPLADSTRDHATGGAREALRRLAQPADRVAPSAGPQPAESFVAIDAPSGASLRVASLAAAAVAAAGIWNAERGAPWTQVGLSIPVGGPEMLGNVSTHRRVDLTLPADVAAAVTAALAQASPPPGAALSPRRARLLRVLAPVVERLSDSLLVSNLGMVDLPGAHHVDFYPQARGRSAVAVGACTPTGGAPRLTLRARDLTRSDAEHLLGAVAQQL